MTKNVPRRKDGVLCQKLGEEIVLYDSQSEAIHVLNPPAHLIWELCDGEHSFEDMERAMREAFSVNAEEEVVGDIQRVIDDLRQKGLVI